MKKVSQFLFVLIFLLSASSSTFAQSFKDRYYQSLGYTVFLDVYQLPSYTVTDISGVSTPVGVSFVSYSYRARINIVDINENTSVDIHSIPTLGFGYTSGASDEIWLGSLSLPLLAGFNIGNVSTYDTKQNHGFGIGLGMEYFQGSFFIINKQESSDRKTGILQPVVELDYRYWSKSNKAKELTFYAGFKGSGASDVVPNNVDVFPSDIKGSFHFRFTWSTYIDY